MFCFLFLLVFFLCWKSFTVGFIFIFFGNIFVSFIYSGYGFFCWIFCWKCYDCNTMYLFALYYLFLFPDLLLCHISFLFPVIIGPSYPVELNLLHRCYVFMCSFFADLSVLIVADVVGLVYQLLVHYFMQIFVVNFILQIWIASVFSLVAFYFQFLNSFHLHLFLFCIFILLF